MQNIFNHYPVAQAAILVFKGWGKENTIHWDVTPCFLLSLLIFFTFIIFRAESLQLNLVLSSFKALMWLTLKDVVISIRDVSGETK